MAKWLLDPGHGGVDPGATYKGIRECDNVLKLALRIGELLKNNNENVYYTRSTDATLSLMERSKKYKPESARGCETQIYAKGGVAEELANKVNSEIVRNGFVNRGIKVSNFHVLRETKCPAILVEVGFIDNTLDNLIFDSKFEEIAQSIVKACLCHIGKSISVLSNNLNRDEVYYRCVVGSFKERVNAESRKAELMAKGYTDIFIDVYKKN